MSFLTLPKGIPDFSKAVISLWFRLPQSSLEAKRVDGNNSPLDALFRYTIPLITFGPPAVAQEAETIYTNVAYAANYIAAPGDEPVLLSPTGFAITGELPINPCYIGLSCLEFLPRLELNIQMQDRAALTHIGDQISRVGYYTSSSIPPGYDPSPGTGWGVGASNFIRTEGIVDVSGSYNFSPEYFFVSTPPALELDHWHHLLLAFDLSTPCITHGAPQTFNPHGSTNATTKDGTDSSCRLWYAIDDVNYSGSNDALGRFYVDGGDNPNAILTENAWRVANEPTGLIGNLWSAPSTCTYELQPIPARDAELGVPAASLYVDSIYPVEMAEFQFFTGVTLDTSVESNRRAFIDVDGKPVNPLQKTNPLDPKSQPGPWDVLGKKPDILLHGSGDWIIGRNTGVKTTTNGTGKPAETLADKFEPTGSIVAYSPDPSLHGLQSPALRPPA